jgi:hypothetical protein
MKHRKKAGGGTPSGKFRKGFTSDKSVFGLLAQFLKKIHAFGTIFTPKTKSPQPQKMLLQSGLCLHRYSSMPTVQPRQSRSFQLSTMYFPGFYRLSEFS